MSETPGRAPRLVLRIYVVMLLAIAVVVAVLLFGKPQPEAPFHPGPALETLVKTVAASRGDARALQAELEKVRKEHHLVITFYGAHGELEGSSAPVPPPPATPEELEWAPRDHHGPSGPPPGAPGGPGHEPHHPPRPRTLLDLGQRHEGPPGEGPDHHGPGRVLIPLSPDGDHAIVQFEHAGPPRADFRFDILIVLVSLGIASLVLGRMIARPLRHIAGAAQAFGAGDLTARSRLGRGDELGDLSKTFDEMADRITHLVRSQRELLASVSHELRTPLSRIRVALDLAAEGDAAAAHQSLRDITEDLGELEELVDDVLAMARLEAQGSGPRAIPRLRTVDVDARAVVTKAATRFSAGHSDRPLQVTADARAPIAADPNLLRRVIENLLENAHKYSPADTPIELTLASVADEAVVTVRDRGHGIAADDLPFVFEPFFRADRSRTRGTGGVGLGLALSKRIVEAHGGRIDIESAVDEGTTVTFAVPLAARPQ